MNFPWYGCDSAISAVCRDCSSVIAPFGIVSLNLFFSISKSNPRDY